MGKVALFAKPKFDPAVPTFPCVGCALCEIIKLCERPDVYAVLDAYQQGKAGTKRKVG
jgi:hypothetical protein